MRRGCPQEPVRRAAAASRIPRVGWLFASDPAGFKREHARFESWVGWSGVEGGLSLTGQGDGFVWSAEVAGEVAHAPQDVRGELAVAADLD